MIILLLIVVAIVGFLVGLFLASLLAVAARADTDHTIISLRWHLSELIRQWEHTQTITPTTLQNAKTILTATDEE